MTTAMLRDLRDGELFRLVHAGEVVGSSVYYARGGGWYDATWRDPAHGVYARLSGLGGPWCWDGPVVRVDAEGQPLACASTRAGAGAAQADGAGL